MKKKHRVFYILASLLSLTVLLIGFQNCGSQDSNNAGSSEPNLEADPNLDTDIRFDKPGFLINNVDYKLYSSMTQSLEDRDRSSQKYCEAMLGANAKLVSAEVETERTYSSMAYYLGSACPTDPGYVDLGNGFCGYRPEDYRQPLYIHITCSPN